MVTNVTSLTGNGLKDWLIQRVTAIYLAVYCVFLFVFLVQHPHLSFDQWHSLFSNVVFQIATGISFFCLFLHSWVGIWTVTTDYLKCTVLRLTIQLFVFLWLLSQFIWSLMIVWGQ